MQPPYHRYLFPLAGKMILLRHKKSPRREASGEYCRLRRIAYYHLISVGKGKEKKRNRQIFLGENLHGVNNLTELYAVEHKNEGKMREIWGNKENSGVLGSDRKR